MEGSFKENLDRLFEGALPQSARIDSVDAVPRDCSEDATVCHDIAQSTEMTIVDVNTVRAEDYSQLADEAEPRSLDTENGKGLSNRVGGCTRCVNFVRPKDLLKCYAVCLDEEATHLVCVSGRL